MEQEELNNLIMSHEPEKILNFYSYFENQEELVNWMKTRPTGKAELVDVSGPSDIVVVIPTKSVDSPNAKICRDKIFQGIKIIFVESGGDDPFFNYARNCNVGIRAALQLDPDWVVISNDDMEIIDSPEHLRESLQNLHYENYSTVFTNKSNYHSYPLFLGYPNLLRKLYFDFSNRENRIQQTLENKFGIRVVVQNYGKLQRNFFRAYTEVTNIGAFGIFSASYLNELGGKLFDETYLNEFEEVEVSYNLRHSNLKIGVSDYRIGDLVGTGLGKSTVRKYRAIASRAYFNYKIKNGQVKFVPEL